MNKNIAVLVLAAGAATRMGSIKQLLPWKGSTLLENALQTAVNSSARYVTLITGANAEAIINEIKIPKAVAVVFNNQWTLGLSSSINCGLHHILEGDLECDAVLMLMADQPLIDTEYLNNLISEYHKGAFGIVATSYESGPGVPVIFDRKYFEELRTLAQDKGAKSLIKANMADTFVIDPLGKERDIDTPADYSSLSREAGKR
ncbi:MAG: NTP transferase domain-containing protein [Flavobacteriaceae bacterium]